MNLMGLYDVTIFIFFPLRRFEQHAWENRTLKSKVICVVTFDGRLKVWSFLESKWVE